MERENIHFVTGRLAEHALRSILEPLADAAGFDYSVAVMPISVAALGGNDDEFLTNSGQGPEVRRAEVLQTLYSVYPERKTNVTTPSRGRQYEKISCFAPIPLRPRPRPPALPDVTNAAADTVSVFDGGSLLLLDTVPTGDDPMGVAVDPGLNYAFVGNRASNSLTSIPDTY